MFKQIKIDFFFNTKLVTVLSMFIFLFSTAAFSQEQEVTGVVKDSKDIPLPGVNVLVKTTGKGTMTDADGKFTIKVQDENSELEFTYVGYKTMLQKIGNSATLEIVLKEGSQELEEVVVVGYSTQKKKDLTGAVSSVKMDDIKDLSTSGIISAIQGRASGVTILQSSGTPGSPAAVRIRGIGTFGNSEPLYIIDGMPADNMNDLNPNDIERMDILKDAASAAIYGSRAANGVVIIQTKKGSNKEKTNISFNTYVGLASPTNKINVLNAEQRNMIHTEAFANDGIAIPDPNYYTSDYAKVTRTNWMDEIFTDSAVQKNYDLGISGASTNARYNVAFGNLDQEGILKNTGYDKTTFRLNTEIDVFKNMKFGENLMITSSEQTKIQDSGDNGAIASALRYDPSVPVYDPVTGGFSGSGELGTDLKNPVSIVERSDNKTRRKRIFGDMYAEYKFWNDFTAKTDFGYDWSRNDDKEFFARVPEAGRASDQNELFEGYVESTRMMNTTTLKYDKTFSNHHIMALGGTSYEVYNELNGRTSVGGFISEDPSQRYISASTYTRYLNGGRTEWALQSYFARVNYDYLGKYLFSVSYRADGSSKFAKDNRWGYFPSVSAGWRISDESFFDGVKDQVQSLKLRASYGSLGNQNIFNNYPTKALLSDTQYKPIFGITENAYYGRYESSIPNPNLKWEVTTQTDLGLDLTFLKNFDLVFDYFVKESSDILLQVPITSVSGVTENPWRNAADVQNKGYEVSLSYNTKINDLGIRAYGNLSQVKNEVTSLGDGSTSAIYSNTYNGQAITRTTVGGPISHYFGYKTDGIFKSQAEVDNYKNSAGEKLQSNAQVGDVKFVDYNKDGKIGGDDRTNIGDGFPDVSYGFGADLDYKGFDLSLFFQGVAGFDVFNAVKYQGMNVNPKYNQFSEILDRYHPVNNPNGSGPRVSTLDENGNKQFSDLYVEKGDYLRLKNITLGYSLNKELLKKVKLDKLRLYVNLQNYLTFSKYNGFDPEVGGNSGVDYAQFPQPKTFLMGLNINL